MDLIPIQYSELCTNNGFCILKIIPVIDSDYELGVTLSESIQEVTPSNVKKIDYNSIEQENQKKEIYKSDKKLISNKKSLYLNKRPQIKFKKIKTSNYSDADRNLKIQKALQELSIN